MNRQDPIYFDVVHNILSHSLSAFEQYTVLLVVRNWVRHLGVNHLIQLQDTLRRIRDSDGRQFTPDSLRAKQLNSILQEIRERMSEESAPSKAFQAVRGKVDVVIITTREDEFRAVIARFPGQAVESQNRVYQLSQLPGRDGATAVVAVARASEQGPGVSELATGQIIDDLKPHWVLHVGLASGIPDSKLTLGDVVVSTQVVDLTSRTIFDPDSIRDPVTLTSLAHMGMESTIGGWNTPEAIGRDRPPVDWNRPESLEGDAEWKLRVAANLRQHFSPSSAPWRPVVHAGPIISSAALIKDVQALQQLLRQFRNSLAVDMESAGVFRAALNSGRQPRFVSIHGISDIVGFKGHTDWMTYACHSAAAFTLEFVRSVLLKRGVRTILRPED